MDLLITRKQTKAEQNTNKLMEHYMKNVVVSQVIIAT